MKNLISISLVFENGEHCEIPQEYINSFYVGEITKSLNFYPHNQGVREYITAGSLRIQFKKSFLYFQGQTQCGTLAVNRITQYKDICWFEVKYEDGESDSYQVKWEDVDSSYENPGQRIERTKGQLEIYINM